MGTHPIFESDFDCLTDCAETKNKSKKIMPELDLQKDINRAIELLKSLQNNPSLPSDKLKSLQEVLESDFLYSITNVYQSIYDTVDLTHSSKESAAIATAKATVAAFAAAEGH